MTRLNRAVFWLFCLFCVAYPIAVIGVAFDVHPPFSMTWAGSVLFIIEGVLLTFALMDEYGPFGLFAVLLIAVVAYGIEALGVATGFPFGAYRYTDVLFLHLPGGVPLAVIFAWLLIMIAVHGLTVRPPLLMGGRWQTSLFFAAVCATLLDLELEPVAFHLQHYWTWLAPGAVNYYGVPLVNFAAWFVVALVLSCLVGGLLSAAVSYQNITSFSTRLPLNVPTWLYFANVFMFGLVDLTHGYYIAVGIAVVAALLPFVIPPRLSKTPMPMVVTGGIGDDELAALDKLVGFKEQPVQTRKKQVQRTKKARKKPKR
ncbi:MAG: carotenoid biosynthesis protein [Ktedonobacteraceae bacterium]